MQGPYSAGTHNGVVQLPPDPWEERNLVRGMRYRVNKGFTDNDGQLHSEGEEWIFVASMFSIHDDVMMVVIRGSKGDEWRILLDWQPNGQQDIIENICEYVVPTEV
jgi:hypothetical protein